MSHNLVALAVTSTIVAVDNALLAGIVLPWTERPRQQRIITAVGIALAVSQIALAMGIGHLLSLDVFRAVAIAVLVWLSIRTLTTLPSAMRAYGTAGIAWRVFAYTAVGNLDNMIWLGSEVKGEYFWLVACSLATIPLFAVVALFLADQCARHHWTLLAGSAMMAWAAARLIVDTPAWQPLFRFAAVPIPQILVTAAVLAIGLLVSRALTNRSP